MGDGNNAIDFEEFKAAAEGEWAEFFMKYGEKIPVPELFAKFDVDGGGDIDKMEFVEGCHRSGLGEPKFYFGEVFDIICLDLYPQRAHFLPIYLSKEEFVGAAKGNFKNFFMQDLGFRSRLEELFSVFDIDGGGDIDREEFIEGCERLGMKENDLGFGEIFEIIDTDGSNGIDFEEFTEAVEGPFKDFFMKIKGKAPLRRLFDMFDTDNSGEITKSKFVSSCRAYGMEENGLGFGDIFDLIDTDGSNAIDFDEFQEAIEGNFKNFFKLSKIKWEETNAVPEKREQSEGKDVLRELYDIFDEDCGGDIDRDEFIEGCLKLGTTASDLGYGEIFDLIHTDGSNGIDFEEFKKAATGKFKSFFSRKKKQLNIRKLYFKFDIDRGGDIDREEFMSACERLGMSHNTFGLGDVFDLIDEDGSNAIDFEQFKAAAEGHFRKFFMTLLDKKKTIGYLNNASSASYSRPIKKKAKLKTLQFVVVQAHIQ